MPFQHAGLTALLVRQRWLLRLAGFRSAGEAKPEIEEEQAIHAMGLHTAVDRREAVSAGAGAGIASAFGERAWAWAWAGMTGLGGLCRALHDGQWSGHGMAWLGMAWHGMELLDAAWVGHGMAEAWHPKAWHGMAEA